MAQWATVCVAVVNVILLWQGIQARREERRRREKEQAQRVTLGIKEHLERQSPSSARVLGFTVDVRNDSDRQVHLHRLMLVEHATWKQRQTVGARTLSTKGLPLGQSFLRPGDSLPSLSQSTTDRRRACLPCWSSVTKPGRVGVDAATPTTCTASQSPWVGTIGQFNVWPTRFSRCAGCS